VIHFHGLPITPEKAAIAAIENGFAFVSHRYPDQLGIAVEYSKGFAADNGAFSAWKSGNPITDWTPYYQWVEDLRRIHKFQFAIIPDVINGTEKQNDDLINQWPWRGANLAIGLPVWHLHESLSRLERLSNEWPYIALGSSGQFAQIGTPHWWNRMAQAMAVLCDSGGRPRCKFHGLRQLAPDLTVRFPYASGDSTDIAQNIGIDSKWTGAYQPETKAGRAQILRHRIESRQSPIIWHPDHRAIQPHLFAQADGEAA